MPTKKNAPQNPKRPAPKRPSASEPKGKAKPKKTSRTRQPAELSLEQWQTALRREFGREQNFKFKNVGAEPIFSEYVVSNPATEMAYRVAIRGRELGRNYCSCRDYAVNTLGTCKHIEFLLKSLERKRGGKAAFRQGFQPPYSEVYLRYGPKREVVFGPGSDCPEKLPRLAAAYFDQNNVLELETVALFDRFLKEANVEGHELRVYDDALAFVVQLRDDARRRANVDRAFPNGPDSPAFKKLLKVPLYPYQREGALFAARAGRCLLADEMGLGKTIQALAAAEMLARTVGVERVLIVSPTSLKHQWQQEIEKFCRRSAEVVEGLIVARKNCYATDTFYKITNYDVVHRDLDLIHQWAPDLIVLDEAQRIKNWKTRTAQSVKKLASEYALVLTGTPLENRLEELHSIVEFVDRFQLGPSFRFLAEHQHVDENGRIVGYRNLSQVSKTLEPILIRRGKSQVLKELPERLEKKFFVPMTKQQMMHHEENRETVAKLAHKWRRRGFLTEKEQRILMVSLQNMRMSCNSTYLLDQKTDFGVKADELMTLLEEIFSGNGAKVVVFSQWTRTHELIRRRLEAKKIGHVFFHGGVPSKNRKSLIQRFKHEPDCRVFLSTDAGGVGLNLQNASAVVNMDQPWNPAVLEQRIGRVHRLGQLRPVRVVNFISQGTIEHGMLDVLKFKASLFSGVLDGGQDEVFLGGSRFKRFMETVEKSVAGIPTPMPAAEEADEQKDPEAAAAAPAPTTGKETPAEQTARPASTQQQAWAEVMTAGLGFLEKLGQAVAAVQSESTPKPAGAAAASGQPDSPLIGRDADTGQSYLKLPVPEPETLKKVAELFSALAGK